jgi:hypothetical protein
VLQSGFETCLKAYWLVRGGLGGGGVLMEEGVALFFSRGCWERHFEIECPEHEVGGGGGGGGVGWCVVMS